jgi:hypothetical protein
LGVVFVQAVEMRPAGALCVVCDHRKRPAKEGPVVKQWTVTPLVL